jgi:hypothetical protein
MSRGHFEKFALLVDERLAPGLNFILVHAYFKQIFNFCQVEKKPFSHSICDAESMGNFIAPPGLSFCQFLPTMR